MITTAGGTVAENKLNQVYIYLPEATISSQILIRTRDGISLLWRRFTAPWLLEYRCLR
jgi:hypothetical protein